MLIECVAYENGHRLGDVAVERIGEALRHRRRMVWVDLADPTPDELATLAAAFGLHELAVEDALQGHQRPKLEEYGDTLFAVMQLPSLDNGRLSIGEVDVFVGPNFVVSVRNRLGDALADVRERCEREPGLLARGPGFVLHALMDAVVDRYFPLLDALEGELESAEARIFRGNAARENIEALYRLKRRTTRLRHSVQPLLEAVGKLYGGRVPPVVESSTDYFRDIYDHLARLSSALDNLRDTIVVAVQVNLSLLTVEQGETTKRLAAWAGIFAVATAFAGIWGMNFRVMPELQWRFGYALAVALIALTCGVLYWRFRRAGWL